MSPEAEKFLSGYGHAYVNSGCPNPEGWIFTSENSIAWMSAPPERPYAGVVDLEDEAAFTELIENGYVELCWRGWRLTTLGVDWIMKNIAPAYEAGLTVLSALRVRGFAVSYTYLMRLMSEKDPGRIKRWLEKAAVAASVDELFNDAS